MGYRTIDATGEYSVKDTGESVSFEFTYPTWDTLAEATGKLGESEVSSLARRMAKIDAGNVAREKARSANGHSTRPILSEEQKATNKADRDLKSNLFKVAKERGMSVADILALLKE